MSLLTRLYFHKIKPKYCFLTSFIYLLRHELVVNAELENFWMLSQAPNEENNRSCKRTGTCRESVSPWSCFHICLSLCMSLGEWCLFKSINFSSKLVFSKWGIPQGGAGTPEAVHTGGWLLWSKKYHPVPRVRALPCKQQLCALAGASIPLFKEAKAILPSTGPETSLTANVSWTKSLLVPSGALLNQNLTQIPGTLALFHLCQEFLLSSPSCVRDSHYEWHGMAAQQEGGTSSIASCEGSLVRGSVTQLLLKADRNFTQHDFWHCPAWSCPKIGCDIESEQWHCHQVKPAGPLTISDF